MDYEEKLQAVAWMLDEVSTTQETIRILREAFPENLEPAKDARELSFRIRGMELENGEAAREIERFVASRLARPEPSSGDETRLTVDEANELTKALKARAEKAEIARDSWRRTAEKLEGEKQNAESEAKVLLEALKKIAESEYEGGAWCSEKARAALAAALEGTK
jgi:hypothetical protein